MMFMTLNELASADLNVSDSEEFLSLALAYQEIAHKNLLTAILMGLLVAASLAGKCGSVVECSCYSGQP